MIGCGQNLTLSGVAVRFWRDEEGATAIEYGLIISLIFLAISAAIKGYTEETKSLYSEIQSNLES